MNEDELRAFLESATADDKNADGNEADESGKDSPRMSFEELMGIKRDGSSDAAAAAEANGARGDSPTEQAASEPRVADPERDVQHVAAPVAPRAAQNEPDLVPIQLPGPPQASKPSTAPFWEQNEPKPTDAEPAADQSEPLPATAPLPVGASQTEPHMELFGSDPLPAAETSEYEKISVVGSEKSRSRYVPWVIVGAGAILAIVASLVVVFAVRGGEEPAPTTAPTTQEPVEPTTVAPTEEPTIEPTETEPAGDEAPEVEVGDTGDFEIASWGVKGQISSKFGWPRYTISGENLTFEGGTLLPQFPESCAAMRTGFGITKMADGTFEVYRPAGTCDEAPDFYNEVWGLTAAIIPTLKAA